VTLTLLNGQRAGTLRFKAHQPTMQRRFATLVAAFAALMAQQPAQAEAPICSQAGSTVEMSICVRAELEKKDRALKQAMQAIPVDAAAVPSDTFLPLWKDTLTGFFKSTTDPQIQFDDFRKARSQACVYMNSLAFQGTGFGIFVTNCEIQLTNVLLEKLGS
jgi:hypothetical protein